MEPRSPQFQKELGRIEELINALNGAADSAPSATLYLSVEKLRVRVSRSAVGPENPIRAQSRKVRVTAAQCPCLHSTPATQPDRAADL
jgi:hypothetical protein